MRVANLYEKSGKHPIISFEFLVFALALFTYMASDVFAQGTTYYKDIECIPQAMYGFRADGKTGREILVNFLDGRIYNESQIEVVVDRHKEITNFTPPDSGFSSYRVLLPENIGVEEEAKVSITLIQKNKKIKKLVVVPPMRHWNVFLYNHSHVDIGYSNTHKNVEIIHKRNVIEGINLARSTDNYPEGSRFRWNPEVTWPIERVWNTIPEERENILKAIREGHLSVDASYLNFNTSASSDEELFHTFDFSRKLKKLTGKPIDVFQQMDIPGMSWGLIPVLAHERVKYVMVWPNTVRTGNTHKDIDHMPFWWMGQDGISKVLFLQPKGYATSGSMDKGRAVGRPWLGQRDISKVPSVIKTGFANVDFSKQVTEMEKPEYPYDYLVLSWSLWDNTPLDADIPHAVKAWNEKYAYPHIIISGGHDIMEYIEKKYGDQLPVLKGDFTEYWTDGLGSAAKFTAMNRNAKEKLVQAETIWSMLRPGNNIPRDEFDEAWRYIALSTEHTWCYENPKEPYFQDAIWKVKQDYFHQASDRTQVLLDEALAPVTDKSSAALGPVSGPANGGVAVFNTNSWRHSGLVTLSKSESQQGDCVQDKDGIMMPSQRLSNGELVFVANDVPALGSHHYRVIKGENSNTGACKISGTTLENQHIRVKIDSETGNITQLINLSSGHDFVNIKENGGLNTFHWLPANADNAKSDSNIVIDVVESGLVVVELRVISKALGCRSVSRSVRLIHGLPWIEITNVVDKLPLEEKDGVHFGFGFNIPEGRTRIDIPFGVMEVEKDQLPQANRNWMAMQRWLNISNHKESVTMCSLDAPLIEYGTMTANITKAWSNDGPWIEKFEPSSTIYSWVMNNHWFTNFPLTQDGPVTFRYRIMMHNTTYDVVAANKFGMEQAQPFIHVAANKDPKIKPLIAVDNQKVYVTIIKVTTQV